MRRIFVSVLLATLAGTSAARADVIPPWPEWYLPLPALEQSYGGLHPTYFETSFDYGFAFQQIAYAHLLVNGVLDPNTPPPGDLAFQATLNGVPSGEYIDPSPGNNFSELAPIVPPLSADLLLNGHGTIGLRVNQIGTPEYGADVQTVEMVICGTPVPEPATMTLLAALLACRRRRV